MQKHAPTIEQAEAVRLAVSGVSLAIEAGAGTGKTSTLRLIADALPGKRIQYIAFNKAIVQESRAKFPRNVYCSTAHSLAYRAVGGPFDGRMKQGKRVRSIDIANRLRLDPVRVTTFDGEQKMLASTFLAGVVLRSIEKFCQSADPEPAANHIPTIPGLDAPARREDGSRVSLRGPANREVAKALVPALRRAWKDLSNPEGGLPFTRSIAMSVILKLWHLSEPRIGADVVLFDEAQDANPVMVAVVSAQKHAQLIWVGDSQQQIYAFTGAVNALQTVPSDQRTFLTQSFRFGPAVATVANMVLDLIASAELRLTGYDQIGSVVGPVVEPDVVLTRTNAEAVRTVLGALSEEKKTHLVGGGSDVVAFCKAARDLQNGVRTDHPELACFENWGEVQEYVAQDEQGGDLKLLVELIDEFGSERIIGALEQQAHEDEADLVVSTAHKSKGREWDAVQIAGDFQEDKIVGNDDELRLLYVAVTRARRELDVDAIPFLRDGYKPEPEAPVATTAAAAARHAEGYGTVESVATKPSEHVGTVGGRIDLILHCDTAIGMSTKYGYTHLTRLVDDEGNVFKAFLDDELEAGRTYRVIGKVKSHGEFRGVKETELNRVDIEERPPAGTRSETLVSGDDTAGTPGHNRKAG